MAADLIVRQGEALAEYATAVIRRYDMTELAFDVVLAGSLFKGQGSLSTDTITAAVARVAHGRVWCVQPRTRAGRAAARV